MLDWVRVCHGECVGVGVFSTHAHERAYHTAISHLSKGLSPARVRLRVRVRVQACARTYPHACFFSSSFRVCFHQKQSAAPSPGSHLLLYILLLTARTAAAAP